MNRRHFTYDEWIELVRNRKADVGELAPKVKRTLPRDPDKRKVLVDLIVRRMERKFPQTFEVVGPRRFRLRGPDSTNE
jgi:hypothetical protein